MSAKQQIVFRTIRVGTADDTVSGADGVKFELPEKRWLVPTVTPLIRLG